MSGPSRIRSPSAQHELAGSLCARSWNQGARIEHMFSRAGERTYVPFAVKGQSGAIRSTSAEDRTYVLFAVGEADKCGLVRATVHLEHMFTPGRGLARSEHMFYLSVDRSRLVIYKVRAHARIRAHAHAHDAHGRNCPV